MDINGKNLPSEKRNMLLFMMLVQQYERIAKMNLGEIPNPAHNQIEVDLQSARFAIDTLDMLKAYSKGNITNEAMEYLGSTLSALRSTLEAKSDKGE